MDEFHITAYAKDATGAFVANGDITSQVLDEPIVLFVVSLSLADANDEGMQQIVALANHLAASNIKLHIAKIGRAHV